MGKILKNAVIAIALLAFAGTAMSQRYEERTSRGGDVLQIQQLTFSHAGLKQSITDTLIGTTIGDADTTLAIDTFGADKIGLFLNVRWMDTANTDTVTVEAAFSVDGSNYTAYTVLDSVIGTNDLSNTYHAVALWPVGPVITNSDTVVATVKQGSMVTNSTVLSPAVILHKAGYDPSLYPWLKLIIKIGDQANTDSVNVAGTITKVYEKQY